MTGLARRLGWPRGLFGDPQAARVVPPSGMSAALTGLAAAAMSCLLVFAIAFSLAAGRLAKSWQAELSGRATIRVTSQGEEQATDVATVLGILRTTPGVVSARALSDDEQAALLEPWLGPDLPIDALPVPRLVDVAIDEDVFDPEALRLRLAGEVPAAILDDHARWRAPLARAGRTLQLVGWLAIGLIAAATAAMVTLAANAALASHRKDIAVLRLVGATDEFIIGAFVRRFTLRSLVGAAVGAVLALIVLILLPTPAGSALDVIGPGPAEYALAILSPLVVALIARFATRLAARRMLEDMP